MVDGARGERGVMLIMVGLWAFMLMAASAFVVDYGVLWLGRREAQNAADAGALAGAIALELDDVANFTTSGLAYTSALTVARTPVNRIFGGTHGVHVDVDPATMGSWSPLPPPTCLTNKGCVQVNVYQDGTNSSAGLPTFFGPLLGVTTQRIRATATAQVVTANESPCRRPWFIPDQYTDTDGDGRLDPGEYTVPGYRVEPPPGDIGRMVTFHKNSGPSAYGQLDVGNGGAAIRAAIEQCAAPYDIGQTLPTKPGNTLGPERQGIDKLFEWDPDSGPNHVQWNPNTKQVEGGCAARPNGCTCPGNPGDVCPYYGRISPRIVEAAVCDPTTPYCSGSPPGTGSIEVTNILSFFITGYRDSSGSLDIDAVIIGSAPGNYVPGAGNPPVGASFIKIVLLVR